LYDANAVTDVIVGMVNDKARCMVEMTPGLDASVYDAYQRGTRDQVLKHTKPYIELKAKYDALMIKYIALIAEVARLRGVLAGLVATYNDLESQRKQQEKLYNDAVVAYNTAKSTLQGLQTSIALEVQTASSLENSASSMPSLVAASQNALSEANKTVATSKTAADASASSLSGAQATCDAAQNDMNTISGQIRALEGQISSLKAQMASQGIPIPNMVCADISGSYVSRGQPIMVTLDPGTGRGVADMPTGGSKPLTFTSFNTFSLMTGGGFTATYNAGQRTLTWNDGSTWTRT
jgi:hypothetical protein